MKALSKHLTESLVAEGQWSSYYDDHEPEGKLAAYVYDASVGFIDPAALNSLLKKYPNQKKMLAFRGLFFRDIESYKGFVADIKSNKIDLSGYTSWTRSVDTAQQFALTSPTNNIMLLGREFFKSEDQRRKVKDYTQGYGVIIETVIRREQAIDVSLVPHVSQEDELILPAGNYVVKILKTFKPHRQGVKDIVDLNEYVMKQRKIKSGLGQQMDYSMLEHILANYEEQLNDDSRKHLFQMFSGGMTSASWVIKTGTMDSYDAITKAGQFLEPERDDKYSSEYGTDSLLKDKKQVKAILFAKGFNRNLLAYLHLFTDADQEKVKQAIDQLGGSLVQEFEMLNLSTEQDYFFRVDGLEMMSKFMDTKLASKIGRLLNIKVGEYYKELNSKASVDKINSLIGKEQAVAIDSMVNNMKKLFKNLN